jgi:4'-phosphopantetheinyl transferase
MAQQTIWLGAPRPSSLSLSPERVHLWRVWLSQTESVVQRLASLLSLDEKRRSARYRFAHDRDRYIVGRGALRAIAGHYLNCSPRRLMFSYTEYGKPFLPNDINAIDVRFNLAHSKDVAVMAFTRGREVGIDLEFIQPMPDATRIAEHFFSAGENRALAALPVEERQEAFFRCWTRKEAYVKALGEGLSHPLDQFQVSLAPQVPARLVDVEGSLAELARWSMTGFDPAPGYIAAMVVEGPKAQLEHWQFDSTIAAMADDEIREACLAQGARE